MYGVVRGIAEPPGRPPILGTVVEQHASEAAFLWRLRDAAAVSPRARRIDVARLDERVEAHLDALRIAGVAGLHTANDLLAEALTGPAHDGEVFVVASLAAHAQNFAAFANLLAYDPADRRTLRAAVAALAWSPHASFKPWIERLLAGADSAERFVGIAVGSAWRQDPQRFKQLLPALREALIATLADPQTDLDLRRRALDAIGECALADFAPVVRRHLESAESEVRLSAARAAVLLGERSGARVLAELAAAGGSTAERAAALAVRCLDWTAAAQLTSMLASDACLLRTAIVAAGALGDPARICWLIEQMKNVELARLAAEMLALLTGVDLEDAGLALPPVASADDLETANDNSLDDDLPRPDPQEVAAWWAANAKLFVPEQRYLLGAPIHLPHMEVALKIGTQRQRAAAAIASALLMPPTPLVEVRAQNWRLAWRSV